VSGLEKTIVVFIGWASVKRLKVEQAENGKAEPQKAERPEADGASTKTRHNCLP